MLCWGYVDYRLSLSSYNLTRCIHWTTNLDINYENIPNFFDHSHQVLIWEFLFIASVYLSSRPQYQAYTELGKTIADNVPFVRVCDVITYLPQINYMVSENNYNLFFSSRMTLESSWMNLLYF